MENKLITFVFATDNMDEYQRGFITGLMYLLSGRPSETYRWRRGKTETGKPTWIKELDCTVGQAMEIHDEIEKHFPGSIIEMI